MRFDWFKTDTENSNFFMGDCTMKTRMKNKGFTLVEILIVVVILGILAAIVIPQFTQASTDAKESSLMSNLQSIRSQIELYKIQHNDMPPSDADQATFLAQMTTYSDVSGTTNATKTAVYKFGPYLQKIPANPFDEDGANANVVVGAVGDGWAYAVGADTYSYTFVANDTLSTSDGIAHSAL